MYVRTDDRYGESYRTVSPFPRPQTHLALAEH